MGKRPYVGMFGTDAPTCAAMPFIAASGHVSWRQVVAMIVCVRPRESAAKKFLISHRKTQTKAGQKSGAGAQVVEYYENRKLVELSMGIV